MRGWGRADRRVLTALLLAAAPAALAAQEGPSAAPHQPISYEITVVTSDTGAYLLGEVEIGWQLESVNPVEMELDSTMDVIRVLVDGKPNTRLSRTMYSRDSALVIVPHEKAPGDTVTTRVRYHGIPAGGFRAGTDRTGARAFAGSTAGEAARLWLPMPKGTTGQATVAWNVQASKGQRVVANGELTGVDTLNYGHSTWHFRTDRPIPLDALAVAADPAHPRLTGLVEGLPVAGFSGSLAYRFAQDADPGLGYVRAKTGTLTGVHGLAGLAVGRDGSVMTFVAVADRVRTVNTLFARARLDRVAAALAGCACADQG